MWLRNAFVVGAALVGAMLPSGAWAHAAYESSDPGNKSTVSSPPGSVTANFTEPLADGSYLQVTDPCGERVDSGDVSIVADEMTIQMDGTAAGRYVVYFKAFSSLDPHVTQGEFWFEASSGEACPGEGGEDAERQETQPAPRTDREASSGRESEEEGDAPEAGLDPQQRTGRPREGTAAERNTAAGRTNRRGPAASEGSEGEVSLASDAEDEATSVYDGIPLGSLMWALALAAVIGAAGGKIYAGIMGPRA